MTVYKKYTSIYIPTLMKTSNLKMQIDKPFKQSISASHIPYTTLYTIRYNGNMRRPIVKFGKHFREYKTRKQKAAGEGKGERERGIGRAHTFL